MRIYALVVCVSLSLVACGQGAQEFKPDRDVLVEDIPPETYLPVKLWNFLEGVESPDAVVKAASDDAHASASGDDRDGVGALLMPVHVILTEKNPGVLVAPVIRVRFPRGGGTLDLSQWVTEKPGSFYMRFDLPEAGEDPTSSWFVSRARARKFGDEIWGAGCKKFFRLPMDLSNVSDGPGLKANTTQDRHIAVLGGTYVFGLERGRQKFVTQVSLIDSRKPHLFCREP